MRAWLTRDPWEDHYVLRLAVATGRVNRAASGVDEKGNVIWTTVDEMAAIPPFLKLREDAVEAIVRAMGEVTQSSDQTLAALHDSNQVRDRLLTLVEHVVTKEGSTESSD